MASGLYRINKVTISTFFRRRLLETFKDLVAVSCSRVVGDEENPRFWIRIDNLDASNMRGTSKGSSLPMPVGFSVAVKTDGSGNGDITLKFYDVAYSGRRTFLNTNNNLRKWGFPMPADDKVPAWKYTASISRYDVETPVIEILNKLRGWTETIANFKVP